MAYPALSYHSSFDTLARIEPDTLKRNALMAGTYAWGFATADADTCDFLADAIHTQMETMLNDTVHPRKKQLLRSAADLALHSLCRISGDNRYPAPEFVTPPAPDYAKASEQQIPQRIMEGALTFSGTKNGKTFRAAWNADMNIPVFWIDGKRNLWQIAYLSAVEKGKCSDEEIQAEMELLTDYFACLSENGYIRWL